MKNKQDILTQNTGHASPVHREPEVNEKDLSISEIMVQSLSLIFAVRKGRGMKRAADLLETNPKSVILAGLTSMLLFFGFCFSTSQLVLRLV